MKGVPGGLFGELGKGTTETTGYPGAPIWNPEGEKRTLGAGGKDDCQ